ncbi:hypothetical protein H9L39_17061 [Fusarium oxysporum f. sp. albedinis]|nr:hypothetical protein H9L39_17061 [Fusarium oxysporum f. sp. albedinis]
MRASKEVNESSRFEMEAKDWFKGNCSRWLQRQENKPAKQTGAVGEMFRQVSSACSKEEDERGTEIEEE